MTPDSPPEGAENPPFKTKVHFIRKRFIVSIQMHHIPDKFIDLEITPTHLALNTFKYTKKYHLQYVKAISFQVESRKWGELVSDSLFCRFRYPNKIKVDENDVEVDLSGGVLTVTLKIVQILDTNSGKLMAFKGKSKSSAPSSKSQKSAAKAESSESEDQDSEEGDDDDNGDYSEEESEEEVAPKKKSKAPTSVRPAALFPHSLE